MAKHSWSHSKRYYTCYFTSWHTGMGADSAAAALSHLAQLLLFEGVHNLSNRSVAGQLSLALQSHSHGREI